MSLQTNIVEICDAIEARLVARQVLPDASQIVWSARQAATHIKGKADIVIRPRRQISIFGDGGQRYGTVMVRVVDCILRTSSALPELGNDRLWFVEHVQLEDSLINALLGQMLTNQAGEDYLTMPIRYLGSAEEQKEQAVKAANLWGDSVHSFEIHYVPKLVLSELT